MDGAERERFDMTDGMFGPVPDVAERVRLPLRFDPRKLRRDLDRFGDNDWFGHVARQNYEGAWTIVPLRSAAGETHPLRLISPDPGAVAFADTPWLRRAPYFREVLGRFACPVRSVRLMRLAAGSAIRPHCDPYLDAESGRARLHVPIATNEQVEFRLNGRPVAMEPGSCWYLRLTDPHEAANRGDTDRVHLVIDTLVDDWLLAKLAGGSAD